MKFTNLHAHSDGSISDGLFGPKKWVKALVERGFKAHALTDHGSMANIFSFYKIAKENGIHLIPGCEFYYVDNPLIKENENRKNSHLILLAKNYDGYQNLLKLMALSHTDGFYYKNRIGLEWVKKYSEGLVCLTACQGGVLANQIWREKNKEPHEGLENKFKQFQEIFKDDFYVEFQGHMTPTFDEESGRLFNSQQLINEGLYGLKSLPGFKQIITNDCHYITPEHAKIQKALKDMAYGKAEAGESATVTKDHFTDSLWLKNHVEVYKSFREHHEYLPKTFVADGIKNTVEVFEKCKDFKFPTGKKYLPKYSDDSKKLFKSMIMTNFSKMYKEGILCHATKEEYLERLQKEYKVITKYGLEDYFLIVWDLMNYAGEQGTYTGLARGSAAGCLISYLLDIVKIDPLEHKLIFERFLNENRCEGGELPDIDTDTTSQGRDAVKEYIFRKYGKDKVCEIGTYGRMKLKTLILDFGKALGVADFRTLQDITKNLDMDKESPDDLKQAMEQSDALKELIGDNPDFEFAIKESLGQIKSQGVHPAGLIICSEKISDITPIKTQKKDDERIVATQFEDKSVISQGLMKVDILGVKEYDVIKFVIENNPESGLTRDNYVFKIMGAERETPDKKVWKLFQEGETNFVFQFQSDGMKELLVMMKPEGVNDLTAANALYRPGCLENGWHISYCNRKHGIEPVSYIHEDVEDSTSDTYGIMCLAEFSMIKTSLGQRKIKDINIGDLVLAEDGQYHRVLNKICNGQKDTIVVRCSNGEELVCTPDHKVLTQDGWKASGTIVPGDLIRSFFVKDKDISAGNDKDWLIGLALANGDCCASSVSIACRSEDFAIKTAEIAKKAYGLSPKVIFIGRCWYVMMTGLKSGYYNRNPFMKDLKDRGIAGCDCYNKRMLNPTASMIAGLIEGDGCLNNSLMRLRNKNMAYDLYLGLQSMNIPSSYFEVEESFVDSCGSTRNITVYCVSFHDFKNKIPYRIRERVRKARDYLPRKYLPKLPRNNRDRQHNYKKIPFISRHIVERYSKLGESEHWSKVISIKCGSKQTVYDLSVEDVHSFVAGGLVVHNCYQEQVMFVIHKLGKISLVESDIIRSALGKKDKEKLNKFRDKFIKGASEEMPEDDAEILWEQIEKSSSYNFNKSHSAAYATLAYISQYLKVYFPVHFYCANLQWAVIKKQTEDISLAKKITTQKKIKHILPNINKSKKDFYVDEKGRIVWGFLAVKGIGEIAALDLERIQPIESFEDFMKKIKGTKIRINNIEGLIISGAMDEFGDRKDLLNTLYDIKKPKKRLELSEMDFILQFKEMMGFYEQSIKETISGFKRSCITEDELRDYDNGMNVVIGGIITNVSIIKTKRGEQMAFLTLEDMDETIEATLFPASYKLFKSMLKTGKIVEVAGKKSAYKGKQNCVEAEDIKEII